MPIAVKDWTRSTNTPYEAESSSDGTAITRKRQNERLVMGVCPGQIPMPCAPPSLQLSCGNDESLPLHNFENETSDFEKAQKLTQNQTRPAPILRWSHYINRENNSE